jgi:hypothetical protein
MFQHRFAFCASTGRTATMFVAAALDHLPGVIGLHEGHSSSDPPMPRLPLINVHNRRAWHDPAYAQQTVDEKRDVATLENAASNASLLVDVAFYNAPLLAPLARLYPNAKLFALFRRCEGFVRSATIITGEDRQPAGWPDPGKPLTHREQFISLGRLKPEPLSAEGEQWDEWSAIQRNIWLWHRVNAHLLETARSEPRCHVLRYESLVETPAKFWTELLEHLELRNESNVAQCVQRSLHKINQRPSYQIGPVNTWSGAERALYERLARPLESRLYE